MRADDLPISIAHAPGVPLDLSAIPPARGVALFESADQSIIQIVATARLRDAVARRLEPSPDAEAPSRHADLRPITRRVRAITASCPFECDLIFLRLAHAAMPETFRAVMDRRRGWFLHIDPLDIFPRFSVVPTSAMPGSLAPGGDLMGPVADKHAAQRLQQTLEDLFDLCRFHHILVKTPRATACAYKELGKCPAPCDGSETLEAYRARVHAAIGFMRSFHAELHNIEAAMETAAQAMAFERAAALKSRLEAASALKHYKTLHALCDHRMGWAVVAPGPDNSPPRAFVIGHIGVAELASTEPESIAAASRRLTADRPSNELDAAIVGLVGDALHRAARKTQRIVALGAPDWKEQISIACRALSRTPANADDDASDHDTELSAEPAAR